MIYNICIIYGRFKLCLLLLILVPIAISAQEKVSVKTNLLGWSTGSINLGAEIPVSPHFSVGLSGSYNPWKYNPTSKLQHLLIRPEVRYYPCKVFRKFFFGVQGIYGAFNAGGLNIPIFPTIKDQRYIGTLWGGSLIGGYQFPISKHWSFESLIGVGYIRTDGELHKLSKCDCLLGSKPKNYFGITDIALSFIYVFN